MNTRMAVDDAYETTAESWDLVLRYVPRSNVLWDPFYCHGHALNAMETLGFRVVHSNRDAYTYEPLAYDIIATNPPFSQKKQALERILALRKPFVMLLPVTVLSNRYFAELLGDDDAVRFLIPLRRLQFLKDGKRTSSCTFSTMFVTRGLQDHINSSRQVLYIDNSVGYRGQPALFAETTPPSLLPGRTRTTRPVRRNKTQSARARRRGTVCKAPVTSSDEERSSEESSDEEEACEDEEVESAVEAPSSDSESDDGVESVHPAPPPAVRRRDERDRTARRTPAAPIGLTTTVSVRTTAISSNARRGAQSFLTMRQRIKLGPVQQGDRMQANA